MSDSNAKLHRGILEAYNAGDIETFIASCDPRIEFHSTFSVVGGVYHGRDGIREYFRDLGAAEDILRPRGRMGRGARIEPETYCDLGENTLTFYMLLGSGKQSGAEVALPSAGVAWWRDGLLVYWKTYLQREDALKDLGIWEDALEPIDP
jgi:hypothetical protein